jgi:hypothetical protein
MNDVEDVAIHFRGVKGPGQPEQWIRVDAPPGNRDYNHGGTYSSQDAQALEYDTNHNFKLNLWSYDYPRFTRPFYYGRTTNGMTLILMFDRRYSSEMKFGSACLNLKCLVDKDQRGIFNMSFTRCRKIILMVFVDVSSGKNL